MNRFCSIFSQLLQLFSRIEFQQAVRQTKAERHARGFTCWGQFVSREKNWCQATVIWYWPVHGSLIKNHHGPQTFALFSRGIVSRHQGWVLKTVFLDEKDLKRFLTHLSDCKNRLPLRLYVYPLMKDHLHLLIEVEEDPVKRIV